MQGAVTSLGGAAKDGDVAEVARLLSEGVPVNSTDEVSAWHSWPSCLSLLAWHRNGECEAVASSVAVQSLAQWKIHGLLGPHDTLEVWTAVLSVAMSPLFHDPSCPLPQAIPLLVATQAGMNYAGKTLERQDESRQLQSIPSDAGSMPLAPRPRQHSPTPACLHWHRGTSRTWATTSHTSIVAMSFWLVG